MTLCKDSIVVVGRIGGPYGVKGWVHVTSFTQPPSNIADYRPWLLANRPAIRSVGRAARSPIEWQVVDDLHVRPHGDGVVASFPGVEDRNALAGLSGREIAVPRDALPPADPDEFYWLDLEGLSVVTEDGRDLGTVDHILETGANDVLVITDGETRRLLPFIEDVVVDVEPGKRILVRWGEDWD